MAMQSKNPAAMALGRLGGLVKSRAKSKAAKRNAMLPRPGARKPRVKIITQSS